MIDRDSDPGAWAREIAARGLKVPELPAKSTIVDVIRTVGNELRREGRPFFNEVIVNPATVAMIRKQVHPSEVDFRPNGDVTLMGLRLTTHSSFPPNCYLFMCDGRPVAWQGEFLTIFPNTKGDTK